MKITYALTVAALLACATTFGTLGSSLTSSIRGATQASVASSTQPPALQSQSSAASGTLARTATRLGNFAKRSAAATGQRIVGQSARTVGAAVLPLVVRKPELSRLPGLRWSATAANVLDLPSNAGPITAYKKLGPYTRSLATETPMWRAYYSSMRWIKRHLGRAPWEPPSRAPRFEELAYLRNKPQIQPFTGRAADMTWDSVPSSSLPLATVGDVLGEGFANRVWRAELDGKSVAVKARKDDLHWWMDFMTRDQRFAHEVDGASNLHTYLDGPAATVVRFEDNGRMRVGLALDLVEGHSLKQFIAGEATDFPITQAHVASIEQMFAKLDAQGAWLEDLHDGQIMLRKDGSVTPIDMRVEPLGDGNPMVLEYARRRAGVLDSLREIARQN